jgi:hypothetical protein
MVPIPADPQRDLEDESIAIVIKASSTGIRPLKRHFWSLHRLSDGKAQSTSDSRTTGEETIYDSALFNIAAPCICC